MGRQVGKTIGLRLKMAMGSSTRNTLWGRMMNMWKHWRTLKWKRNRRSLRLKREGGMTRRPTWRAKSRQCRVECYRVGKQGDASSNQQGGECGWCKGPGCRLAALKAACWLLEQDQKRRQRNCPGFNRNLQGLGEEAEGAQREVIHCEIFLMVNKCLKVWKISTK